MRKLFILISVMLVMALAAAPASAIMGGELDLQYNDSREGSIQSAVGLANNQSECTLGVNHASITTHDSPVLWRVRDNPDSWLRDWPGICYTVQHYFGDEDDYDEIELDYIAMVHHDDRPVPIHIHGFGLNEEGVGTGQTLVRNESYDYNNLKFTYQILGNVSNMAGVRKFLDETAHTATGNWAFIDNNGNASMFELDPSEEIWYMEYDAIDPDRKSQGLLGFVVRANEYHKNDDGTDDTDVMWRYLTGTENTLGLIAAGEFNEQSVAQSDSNNAYRMLRQTDHPWPISHSTSRDAGVIRGAAPGEDPALATMWAILGQPSFGIAVPTWVAVSDVPEPISTCKMYNAVATMYDAALGTSEERAKEQWVQAAVFPAESHLFEMVNDRLLPHWRMLDGPPSVADQTRIEHQMAWDAYSVVNYLATTGEHNLAPTIDFEARQRPNLKYAFNADAADVDGSVVSYSWDFGDGITSQDVTPMHEFADSGVYLVSVTVADDDGVTTTAWRYLTVVEE